MAHYDETKNRFNPENRFVGDIEDGKRYPFACYTKEESDERYADKNTETSVAALTAVVDTKAAQSDLEAVAADVARKANTSDLENLSELVETKASIGSVEALSDALNTKADQSSLDSLGLVAQNGCLCIKYESEE